ncbi:unnamed protein product [Caenorhabditis auriculariae]|uniref:Uncharacterized protein n=1 Tax=Caenorhabditis auriculariae TaxID=2777116 RepID=A0A8S1HKY8_9PELO|nr:unnamed protein product [Caenorhabditis auriculariae]
MIYIHDRDMALAISFFNPNIPGIVRNANGAIVAIIAHEGRMEFLLNNTIEGLSARMNVAPALEPGLAQLYNNALFNLRYFSETLRYYIFECEMTAIENYMNPHNHS